MKTFKKIDILCNGEYVCSTIWMRTCWEAIERFKDSETYKRHYEGQKVQAFFDKPY